MLYAGGSLHDILLCHRRKLFSSEVKYVRDFGEHKNWKIETIYHWKDPVRFSCRRRHRPDVDPLYYRYDRPLEETVKCQHPKPWTRSTALAVNNTCTSLVYFTFHPPPTSATTATTTLLPTPPSPTPPLHCNSPSPIYTS